MPIKSKLQAEYIEKATRRWNVKTGATRSGKTYLDVAYIIPSRILRVADKSGLILFIGNTKSTLQRNIIEPMQEIFGANRVSSIRQDNTATIFGQKVHCLGADNIKHVDRIRGVSAKYCYGDEITTWSEDVFIMLKSRLDKPYSVFDGTCNPAAPSHWLKAFLESDADIFQQAYTIDDNPFLDPAFVENLKKEYAGTIYYNRYILGQWTAAEGIIYKHFADNPERFTMSDQQADKLDLSRAVIGVDFGGGTSAHAFCCLGFTRGGKIVVLDEYREQQALTPERLYADFIDFATNCKKRWNISECYCDSAEQTLINGLRVAAIRSRLPLNIGNALKKPINDRIRALCILMGSDRFLINEKCIHTIEALRSAVWDSKKIHDDVRLDNGTVNIDSLDAMEYAYERDIRNLIERWKN